MTVRINSGLLRRVCVIGLSIIDRIASGLLRISAGEPMAPKGLNGFGFGGVADVLETGCAVGAAGVPVGAGAAL